MEAREFNSFVEGWDYPVVVVTAAHEDDRAGCLVGFTTQASIRSTAPPGLSVGE